MKKLHNYFFLMITMVALSFALTGCGNSTNGSTSGNNDNNNVLQDAVDDVGTAAEDIANGVGNAVNDLVGNGGFNSYNEAHDYFLDTMGSYHSNAKFELRDEDQELNDYQEGSKGYHFHLYDTSNNENGEYFGEFFVDATNGTIYKKGENGLVTPYPENNSNDQNNSSTSETNNNTTNNNKNNNNNSTNNTTAK